ncbi:MAG: SH3 domain-containing protein [Clostridia bacterium]|nr:SH3 domain-containing protein [Clostridia bacterium]
MPYYITVDLANQIVTVFDADSGEIVRQMICSTGKNNYTPPGVYLLPEGAKSDRRPWYYIQMFHRYVRYPTRIMGEILFHSLPYRKKSIHAIDAQAALELGQATSHGCIRLRWQDARFIAENCLPGTAVKITEGESRDDGLRELLLGGSYDASSGMTYERFLGNAAKGDVLGRDSEGQQVLDLQYRLRALGFYDGDLNGHYGSKTVNAVRAAQALSGFETSGAVSSDFWAFVFSEEMVTAMEVPLKEGDNGPAVRVLQEHLNALRLFDDEIDRVYDAAVVEAVRRFESVYGFKEDGIASPMVQKALAFEAEGLARTFEHDRYNCALLRETVAVAVVVPPEGAKLRTAPSRTAKEIASLPRGRRVLVVERGRKWSSVRVEDREGYVNDDLLDHGQQSVCALKYEDEAGNGSYVIGLTAEAVTAGEKLPCVRFEAYLAANDQQLDWEHLASYVTIDTGDQQVPLNLRSDPSTDSAVIDILENGLSLRVQRRLKDWTQVEYQGGTGYLMNRFLDYWTGGEDALMDQASEEAAEVEVIGTAVVRSVSGNPAEVLQAPEDDAPVLGHLQDGTGVEVLERWEGWCRIRLEGHEGYMLAEELQPEQGREDLQSGAPGDVLPSETLLE